MRKTQLFFSFLLIFEIVYMFITRKSRSAQNLHNLMFPLQIVVLVRICGNSIRGSGMKERILSLNMLDTFVIFSSNLIEDAGGNESKKSKLEAEGRLVRVRLG